MELKRVGAGVDLSVNGQGKWTAIVKRFADSDMPAAEVVGIDVNISSAYSALYRAAKVSGSHVSVRRRGSQLYLVRTDS